MAGAGDGEATETLFNGATACPTLYLFDALCSRGPIPTPGSSPWASCARKRHGRSRPGLPGAVNTVFEAGQLVRTDRTAGVEFAGGNADFGAEAELAAVGELGRCVVQNDRRIDLVEKFAGGTFVLGHDRIGVMRAVIVDM